MEQNDNKSLFPKQNILHSKMPWRIWGAWCLLPAGDVRVDVGELRSWGNAEQRWSLVGGGRGASGGGGGEGGGAVGVYETCHPDPNWSSLIMWGCPLVNGPVFAVVWRLSCVAAYSPVAAPRQEALGCSLDGTVLSMLTQRQSCCYTFECLGFNEVDEVSILGGGVLICSLCLDM